MLQSRVGSRARGGGSDVDFDVRGHTSLSHIREAVWTIRAGSLAAALRALPLQRVRVPRHGVLRDVAGLADATLRLVDYAGESSGCWPARAAVTSRSPAPPRARRSGTAGRGRRRPGARAGHVSRQPARRADRDRRPGPAGPHRDRRRARRRAPGRQPRHRRAGARPARGPDDPRRRDAVGPAARPGAARLAVRAGRAAAPGVPGPRRQLRLEPRPRQAHADRDQRHGRGARRVDPHRRGDLRAAQLPPVRRGPRRPGVAAGQAVWSQFDGKRTCRRCC